MGNALLKRRMKPFELLSFDFMLRISDNQYSGLIINGQDPSSLHQEYATLSNDWYQDDTYHTVGHPIGKVGKSWTWNTDFMSAYKDRLLANGYRYVNYTSGVYIRSHGAGPGFNDDAYPSDIDFSSYDSGSTLVNRNPYFSRQSSRDYICNETYTTKKNLSDVTFTTGQIAFWAGEDPPLLYYLWQNNQARVSMHIEFSKT